MVSPPCFLLVYHIFFPLKRQKPSRSEIFRIGYTTIEGSEKYESDRMGADRRHLRRRRRGGCADDAPHQSYPQAGSQGRQQGRGPDVEDGRQNEPGVYVKKEGANAPSFNIITDPYPDGSA